MEIYLHRVGRTARAGRSGRACTIAAEPDRKVVKQAVKTARSGGAKIASRVIEAAEADKYSKRVDEMADEIQEILKEEKEDKILAQTEMELRKGENVMQHEAEIKGRPRRTWFKSEHDKKEAKKKGRAELNGIESVLKKSVKGKLSGKDRKKLDDHEVRTEGRVWKKGRAEREGGGALAPKGKGGARGGGGGRGGRGGGRGRGRK